MKYEKSGITIYRIQIIQPVFIHVVFTRYNIDLTIRRWHNLTVLYPWVFYSCSNTANFDLNVKATKLSSSTEPMQTQQPNTLPFKYIFQNCFGRPKTTNLKSSIFFGTKILPTYLDSCQVSKKPNVMINLQCKNCNMSLTRKFHKLSSIRICFMYRKSALPWFQDIFPCSPPFNLNSTCKVRKLSLNVFWELNYCLICTNKHEIKF